MTLVVGGVAIVGMGALTACGGGKQAPPTTPTTTTTTTTTTTAPPPPPPSPTEKTINPTGGNLFTPEPVPTVPYPSQNPHAHPPG
jgi:multidrug efflux pump subunit AcrA (membrane-fusion protein)